MLLVLILLVLILLDRRGPVQQREVVELPISLD